MTGSTYQQTALPVKLDLSKHNTAEQLKTGGTSKSTPAEESKDDCTEVMRKHLLEWLERHGIEGPPPDPVAEQRALWSWIRDFHQEYNDDWFSRNMPRLFEQFKPIFVKEMKSRRGSKAPPPAATVDFISLGDDDEPPRQPQSGAGGSSSSGGGAAAGVDLLDLAGPPAVDDPLLAMAPPAPSAPAPPAAQVAASVPATSLLDLDGFGGPPAALAAAPAAPVTAPSTQAGGPTTSLLDLDGFGSVAA